LRQNFNLYTSYYVIEECKLGNTDAAHRRLEFLKDLIFIPKSEQIEVLAAKYLELLGIPVKAKMDCYHLAASVVFKMNCLLSWNFKQFNVNTYIKILKFNINQWLNTPFLHTHETLAAISMPEESL
jgi:hypothetical protein